MNTSKLRGFALQEILLHASRSNVSTSKCTSVPQAEHIREKEKSNFDVIEMFGDEKIREINLDVAQLKIKKLELESKLKIQVLEYILA